MNCVSKSKGVERVTEFVRRSVSQKDVMYNSLSCGKGDWVRGTNYVSKWGHVKIERCDIKKFWDR